MTNVLLAAILLVLLAGFGLVLWRVRVTENRHRRHETALRGLLAGLTAEDDDEASVRLRDAHESLKRP
ncbi:MAG: hypothetical protein AAGI08_00175 [Bacteroidota bacterium]